MSNAVMQCDGACEWSRRFAYPMLFVEALEVDHPAEAAILRASHLRKQP